jgi:hypothetical protein
MCGREGNRFVEDAISMPAPEWGCLLSPPNICVRIIIASAVLHNMCISRNIPIPEGVELEGDLDDDEMEAMGIGDGGRGQEIRRQLIVTRFS